MPNTEKNQDKREPGKFFERAVIEKGKEVKCPYFDKITVKGNPNMLRDIKQGGNRGKKD